VILINSTLQCPNHKSSDLENLGEEVMQKDRSRNVILQHAWLSLFLFNSVLFVVVDSHAEPNACQNRSNGCAIPDDFEGLSNPTRFDQSVTNSVSNLITVADSSGCDCLKLDEGVYNTSRHLNIPAGFHLRGTMEDGVPVSKISAVDIDSEAIRIRIRNPTTASYTISRLLLRNVRVDMRGTGEIQLEMVDISRLVLFDTNYEGAQVQIDYVDDFEVSRNIFLRGDGFGGKGLKTDNSTDGRISKNCFGGQPDSDDEDRFCPNDYFSATMLDSLDLSRQGYFITAWNASEGLANSRFDENLVKGNTDSDVHVRYLSQYSNRDHGIYVKFSDDISITQNRFEGWPPGAAHGHLKVRNASKIKIRSNEIIGMHLDLRPSITRATATQDVLGQNWLVQSCTWIDGNEFEGGSVSYDAVRKPARSDDEQIDAGIWVTGNTFSGSTIVVTEQETQNQLAEPTDYRIRRPADDGIHTPGSYWKVRDNVRANGGSAALFDTDLWISDSGSADTWWNECSP
jgi:hypothetical protein